MHKKHGSWIIKETGSKYTNPWLEVIEDKVIRPDGKSGIFGTVRIKPGVSVLPIGDDRTVYLTEEFKYALGKKSIEVVSGGIDPGETLLGAAKRELKEELGADAAEWKNLGVVNPFTNIVHSPAYLFLARGLEFGSESREGTETSRILKLGFKEAIDMVIRSKITHGPTCVLMLRAREFLKNNNIR